MRGRIKLVPSCTYIRIRYSAGSLLEFRVTELVGNRHTKILLYLHSFCHPKFDRRCFVLFNTRVYIVMILCETECQRFDLLPIVEASMSLQKIADADISMHLQLYYYRPTAITARRVLTLRHVPRYPRENSRLMINRKCMMYTVNPRRILKKTKYTHTQT